MNWSNEWPKEALSKQLASKPEWGEITPATEKEIYGEGSDEVIDWVESKPVTLSIIVNPGDFPTTIEAIQIGDLAVHHDIKCKKEGFWQVTHMPTLTRFNVVPHGLHKQSDLIQWCKNVQASYVEDWKELASLTTDNYEGRSEAKDRIMVLCQGTKIEE